MKYRDTLLPILEWVENNPGLSVAAMTKKIRALSWPGDWNDPESVAQAGRCFAPATTALLWKLRVLEIMGYVEQQGKGRQWYATGKEVRGRRKRASSNLSKENN